MEELKLIEKLKTPQDINIRFEKKGNKKRKTRVIF